MLSNYDVVVSKRFEKIDDITDEIVKSGCLLSVNNSNSECIIVSFNLGKWTDNWSNVYVIYYKSYITVLGDTGAMSFRISHTNVVDDFRCLSGTPFWSDAQLLVNRLENNESILEKDIIEAVLEDVRNAIINKTIADANYNLVADFNEAWNNYLNDMISLVYELDFAKLNEVIEDVGFGYNPMLSLSAFDCPTYRQMIAVACILASIRLRGLEW